MKLFHLAVAAILWMTGGLSVACAHSQERPPHPPPPPFGQDPDDRRPDEQRRERIRQLEEEIIKLETAFKQAENDDRRAELKKRIGERRMQLEELLAQGRRDPKGPFNEKMARMERHIHELEMKLERRDLGPEDRRELEMQLDKARAQMDELRMAAKMQDPGRFKGPGPGMGMPPDPEMQKMHEEANDLDRQSMELGNKLRRLAKDDKGREELSGKLKESVTKLFEVREKIRAREVDMIKKRLEELTDMLEKRKANRDAIIDKRIKQLLGEADPLDW